MYYLGLYYIYRYDPATGAPRALPSWAMALPKAPPKSPGRPRQAGAPGPASPVQPKQAGSGKKRGRPRKVREAAGDGAAELTAAGGADRQPIATSSGADGLAMVVSPSGGRAAGYWEARAQVCIAVLHGSRVCNAATGLQHVIKKHGCFQGSGYGTAPSPSLICRCGWCCHRRNSRAAPRQRPPGERCSPLSSAPSAVDSASTA